MQEYKLKILEIKNIARNVRAYQLEKPNGYKFIPGQATDVAINKPGLANQKRSFTFTSLNKWDYLEFTIKSYNDHNGVTKEIGKLAKGDELIIDEPWGSINYKGEGYFIAGGAGVTPFIAILRDLNDKNQLGSNKLMFANNTKSDIILKDEFEKILGYNFINILSKQNSDKYASGFITQNFIERHIDSIDKFFYVCGPPSMMDAIEKIFKNLGISPNLIVKEKF